MKNRARQKRELERMLKRVGLNQTTEQVLDALHLQSEMTEILCKCGYTLEEIDRKRLNLGNRITARERRIQ